MKLHLIKKSIVLLSFFICISEFSFSQIVNGYGIIKDSYFWGGTSWMYAQRLVNVYDNDDTIRSQLNLQYTGTLDSFQNTIFYYSNHIDSFATYNYELGVWNRGSVWIYKYNGNLHIADSVANNIGVVSVQPAQRGYHEFDINNNDVIDSFQLYNSGSWDWIGGSFNSYDTNHRLILEDQFYYTTAAGFVKDTAQRLVHHYQSNLLIRDTGFQFLNHQFIPSTLVRYHYLANDSLLSAAGFNIYGALISKYDSTFIVRDALFNVDTIYHYLFDSSSQQYQNWIMEVHDRIPVGINSLESNSEQLFIYPNPATDKLTIEIPSRISPRQIEITDALGRKIYTEKTNLKSVIINLKSFPSGIYFIKVQMEDGSVTVRKFVKE